MSKPNTAPASTGSAAPATSDTPEPTLGDLGKIIGMTPPATPAKPAKPAQAAAAAPAADADHDPEFDDPADLEAADDPTVVEVDDPAAPAADPVLDDPAAPAAGDPAAPADEEEADPAAAEPEGLDAEDQAARKGFTPAQQGRFDKAIRKRADKISTLESQLEERDQALATLAAAPAVAAVPTAEDPLADVEDETTLNQRIVNSRALWRWAKTHPNGGTLKDAQGNDVEITAERALEMVVQEEEFDRFHAPARRQLLKDRATQDAAAVQAFPWLKNKASRGSVEIEAMLRRTPALRSVPSIKLILADHLTHRAARLAKTKTPTPGKAVVPVAPSTPAGRNPPPRVAASVKVTTTALKTVAETGRDPNNAALGALIARKK